MKISSFLLPLSMAFGLLGVGSAFAQPQTKLVQDLPKGLIQAIWCSSLFFEESYYYEETSEDAEYYSDLAFDLGDDIDDLLRGRYDLPQAEIDEIWAVFDGGAFDLTNEDDDGFLAQLEMCEANYDDLI
ncbi:hypothetical protein [Pelagibacterium sp.]|uniref:hypothetical protein n=1 Tax=Pelagibacterium sp. TaxID=1967288 RepID=UPI003A93E4B1